MSSALALKAAAAAAAAAAERRSKAAASHCLPMSSAQDGETVLQLVLLSASRMPAVGKLPMGTAGATAAAAELEAVGYLHARRSAALAGNTV